MLSLVKKENQNNGQEFGIITNEGELIISKEVDSLYFGWFEPNHDYNQTKEFRISKEENEDIYKIFNNFINNTKNNHEFVRFISDGFDDDVYASTIIFLNNKNEESVSIQLRKSTSPTDYNSYFVEFEDIDIPIESHYLQLSLLFDQLSAYYRITYDQITLDECQRYIEDGKSRIRTM